MKIEHAYILYIDTPDAIQYMEECKKSCEEHGIPVTPYMGMKLPTTTDNILHKWGFRVDPRVDDHAILNPNHPDYDKHKVLNVWFKEQLCLTGHLSIWKKVANEHRGAVAVFEHDAIIKRNFLDVDVEDGEWVFLGYRVDHRDDYECIDAPFTKVPVNKFEGTHGYALTPNSALHCLYALDKWDGNRGYLPLGVSIDHMMGVQNGFQMKMYVVDPAPVIVPIEQKKSHTQPNEETARYNMIPPDGFLKGLKESAIEKYQIDEVNGWIKF
jgi:GR25 family glycosyltransferase involved in LPS biosynthesis